MIYTYDIDWEHTNMRGARRKWSCAGSEGEWYRKRAGSHV